MKEIDFETATVAEWRTLERKARETRDPGARLYRLFVSIADTYQLADDSVLWPQVADLIESRKHRQ